LDADASAHARYIVDEGRHKFSVEIENVDAGSYTLTVAGVRRGTIKAALVAGTVKGKIEFSTGESAEGLRTMRQGSDDSGGDDHGGTSTGTTGGGTTSNPELPLNFDPRGQTIEISSSAGVFFSHLFGNGSAGASDTSATLPDTKAALFNAGVAPKAEAKAELRQRDNGEQKFEVEIEGAPVGSYDLLVGSTVRSTINVVTIDGKTRGEIEFESSPDANELPLNFDVTGQDVAIQQGGTAFFTRTFPAAQ
jgi:hypothetical protein